MRKLLSILIFLIIWISASLAQSTYTIVDADFRDYLSTQFPAFFDGSGDLIIDSAATYQGGLNCSNLGFNSVDGIQYFTGLTSLVCSQNNLTELPSLRNLTSLQGLQANGNHIESIGELGYLPSLQIILLNDNKLTALPALDSLPALIELNVNENLLVEIPSLNGSDFLQTLIISNNELSALPEISELADLATLEMQFNRITDITALDNQSNLYVVDISNNPLSFSDLTTISSFVNFDFFNVDPLENCTIEGTGVWVENDAFDAFTMMDSGSDSVLYTWKINGVTIAETTDGTLSIDSLDSSFNGNLTVQISHLSDALSGLVIYSDTLVMNVSPCFTGNNPEVFSDYDCTTQGSIDVSGISTTKGVNLVYTVDQNGSKKGSQLLNSGVYEVFFTDADRCTQAVGVVTFDAQECDNIFTPDGDGLNDDFYIHDNGVAKVYGPGGQLINEFPIPGAWDGKDANGQKVPVDLYTIIVNGQSAIQVTVVR